MNKKVLENIHLNKGLQNELATRKRSLDFYSLGIIPSPQIDWGLVQSRSNQKKGERWLPYIM